jgi:hypothetical protein
MMEFWKGKKVELKKKIRQKIFSLLLLYVCRRGCTSKSRFNSCLKSHIHCIVWDNWD